MLQRQVKVTHNAAIQLNAALATHTLKAEYGILSFEEVLAFVKEQRRPPAPLTALEARIEERAVRDVDRLLGASHFDRSGAEDTDGALPRAVYVSPSR